MRVNNTRVFAISIVLTLVMASSVILVDQDKRIPENLLEDPGDLNIPDILLKRGTRAGTDWPMYRNDLLHSGFTSSSVPDDNSILWSNTTGSGEGYGSPVVSDGRVFV